MGYLAHVVAMEEISRASASVGLSYGAHSNLCVNQINRWATPAQKEKYLPPLCSGEHVGALAMSEPGAGSDVVSLQAARRKAQRPLCAQRHQDVDHQRPGRRHAGGLCQDRSGAEARGITAFMVEKAMPGFSVAQKLDKLGMRGSNTGELVFEDVEVPVENVLHEEGRGVEVLMSGLDYERTVLAGGPLGIMAACLDVVVPYVHERKQFGQPIGEFQLVQGKLADMYTTMNAARAYVYAVAAACDRGETTRKDAAGCILFAAEKATQMALDAIQLLGGNGYINEYPTGRLLRDAKLYEIGAGTSEIRRWLIGREIMAERRLSMAVLQTQISPASDTFRANAERMRALVADIARKGGNRRARRRGRGARAACRARQAAAARAPRALLDPGSPFLEIGQFAAWWHVWRRHSRRPA